MAEDPMTAMSKDDSAAPIAVPGGALDDGLEVFEDEHDAFAAARSSQFVYVSSTPSAWSMLDAHADTSDGDSRSPLCLLGPHGSGKSALLANWTAHRARQNRRDEFLFTHYVNASPRSRQLRYMLWRLQTALKENFGLREMKVPQTEEPLRWSLSRFLDAAAKKGALSGGVARIVIILDGVDQLIGEDAPADALHWLPTSLPVGVRFVVSTVETEKRPPRKRSRKEADAAAEPADDGAQTSAADAASADADEPASDSDDGEDESAVRVRALMAAGAPTPPPPGEKYHRAFVELRRRKSTMLPVEPLTLDARHAVIKAACAKWGTSLELEDALVLAIVEHAAASRPMFLRMVLSSLRLDAGLNGIRPDMSMVAAILDAATPALIIDRMYDRACQYTDATITLDDTAADDDGSLPSAQAGAKGVPSANRSDLADKDGAPLRLKENGEQAVEAAAAAAEAKDETALMTTAEFKRDAKGLPSANTHGGPSDASTAPDTADLSASVFAQALSVLYVSRHGLSDDETFGVLEMITGTDLRDQTRRAVAHGLSYLTMRVGNLRMFSHEEYERAVFSKYICTPEAHVTLHTVMARYFGKLPPCDRKLECLVYHLEAAGSWSKLRAALADIDMFKLWWTKAHKTEFMRLWASLTVAENPSMPIKKLVTGQFDVALRCSQSPRPCVDLVEEYLRAVDDYAFAFKPTPQELCQIILQVGDFLLVFADLGLEQPADVPLFVHPTIPNEDMAALGVPYLEVGPEGTPLLRSPLFEFSTDKPAIEKAPGSAAKASEAKASTYFFNRWMWVQFPWIALANCDDKLELGRSMLDKAKTKKGQGGGGGGGGEWGATAQSKDKADGDQPRGKAFASPTAFAHGASRKLPELASLMPKRPFIRRSQSTPAMPPTAGGKTGASAAAGGADGDGDAEPAEIDSDEMYKAWDLKVSRLRHQIEESRREVDTLKRHRLILEKSYGACSDELQELQKLHFASAELETSRDRTIGRIEKTKVNARKTKMLKANMLTVLRMCQRHPAHSQALIDELEEKLATDQNYMDEVMKGLREYSFENNMFLVSNKEMKEGVASSTAMHHTMIEERISQRENLQRAADKLESQNTKMSAGTRRGRTASKAAARIEGEGGAASKAELEVAVARKLSSASAGGEGGGGEGGGAAPQTLADKWEAASAEIAQRTGIIDPLVFFNKYLHAQDKRSQIAKMTEAAERVNADRKEELNGFEAVLAADKLEAQPASGATSAAARDKGARLAAALHRHKAAREQDEGAERLLRGATSGVNHLCEMLGIPPLTKGAKRETVAEGFKRVERKIASLSELEHQLKLAVSAGSPVRGAGDDMGLSTPSQRIASRLAFKAPALGEDESEVGDAGDGGEDIFGTSRREVKTKARAAVVQSERRSRKSKVVQ